jgi:hypothetical protein
MCSSRSAYASVVALRSTRGCWETNVWVNPVASIS